VSTEPVGATPLPVTVAVKVMDASKADGFGHADTLTDGVVVAP
jgi:hypothetical protein